MAMPDTNDLLQRLLHACNPGTTLVPPADPSDLRFVGAEHTRRPHYLFSKKHKLWTTKHSDYYYAFHTCELTFDSLAKCHIAAVDAGTARFDPAAKHSTTRITAVILCDTAQADAQEALTHFKKRVGCFLSPKARLSYRLAAVDRSTGEVVCNRQARKLKSALQAALARPVERSGDL